LRNFRKRFLTGVRARRRLQNAPDKRAEDWGETNFPFTRSERRGGGAAAGNQVKGRASCGSTVAPSLIVEGWLKWPCET
jgi:hypothetical protein